MEIVYSQCKPTFIHEYALAKLKNSNYQIAVCSNSVRKSVESMMELSSLDQYIDLMVSNEDVLHGKPNPEMYLKAMEFFNVQPHECLIIEDNENGFKAARASGGNLLKVENIHDVNLENIMSAVSCVNKGGTI